MIGRSRFITRKIILQVKRTNTNIIVFWACNEVDAGIPGLSSVGIADNVISDC